MIGTIYYDFVQNPLKIGSRKPRLGGAMKRFLFRCPLAVLTLFLLVLAANADTLVLRDGRRIQGRLISVRDNVVEFDELGSFGATRAFRLDRSDVLGIEFD